MYCLSNMCYFCLEQTDNLINIDNSNSINAELLKALKYFELNVYWLNTNRTISVCEKCSLKLRETFEFVSVCHKNSKIFQGYLNLLINRKEINGGEAQLVLPLKNIAGSNYIIKLKMYEDDTAVSEEITKQIQNITMHSCHSNIDNTTEENGEAIAAASEKRCQIKLEIKRENEALKYSQSSLEKAEILINQCHSELDIKEDCLHDTEESEEECYTNNSKETPVRSETSLNACEHTSNKISTNSINEKRNILNQNKGHVSKSVNTENSYKCTQCSKCFRWISYLDRHMRVHSGEPPYNCSICKKGFTIKPNLDFHMRHHTGARLFECAKCSKSFTLKQNLNRHMSIHTGEKQFKCSTCNKCFRAKSILNCHVRIHSGEKPFECSICNKRFKQKSNLNYHVKIHSGENPFECSICNKGFKQKSNLDCHVRIHTGEKPFECSICNKVFKQKSHLQRHIRTHTNKRTFKCT